jgi:hypothetical protein
VPLRGAGHRIVLSLVPSVEGIYIEAPQSYVNWGIRRGGEGYPVSAKYGGQKKCRGPSVVSTCRRLHIFFILLGSHGLWCSCGHIVCCFIWPHALMPCTCRIKICCLVFQHRVDFNVTTCILNALFASLCLGCNNLQAANLQKCPLPISVQ